MDKKQAEARIKKLREEINHHRYLYHVLDKVEISDAALDSLKHELYKLEQQFPDLITPDSPTQRVGGKALEKFKKVAHETLMLSIEDAFSFEEVQDWETRLKKLSSGSHFDYYAEIKMDGLAMSLIYEDGMFSVGSTRGDGKIGEDVTQNLKTIEAIPLQLRIPSEKEISVFLKKYKNIDEKKFRKKMAILDGKIEVRGEAFMRKKVWESLNKEQREKGGQAFAKPQECGGWFNPPIRSQDNRRPPFGFLRL